MRKLQNGETFCGFSESAKIRARDAKNKNKRIAKRACNYLLLWNGGRKTNLIAKYLNTQRPHVLVSLQPNGSTGDSSETVTN